MRARVLSLASGGLACAALLTGCHASVSVGSKSVPQTTVQTETANILAARAKQPTPTVTCPGDLAAKVGESMTCHLVAQGDTKSYPVFLKVDSVSGGNAHWSVSVGSTPSS
jgi:hypothetical protein